MASLSAVVCDPEEWEQIRTRYHYSSTYYHVAPRRRVARWMRALLRAVEIDELEDSSPVDAAAWEEVSHYFGNSKVLPVAERFRVATWMDQLLDLQQQVLLTQQGLVKRATEDDCSRAVTPSL
eukprot:CAMPEP_0114559654 /NCGR_PEP_ID=MMETSP0114-20121206/11035_1 /TAXON_ID=31324 /ORGANISM="Goniomonas sp, Strain m" /LENGTH=122 /DNA_ID=CAMNT_0001745135 /DNA_START=85 /DNA_END=453 /DNA_ORIENTATION=+